MRNNAPGLHPYDFFSQFVNLWHTGPRISVPCIPCTLPFSGRRQSLPRADTHLPAERSAWAAPLRPGPGSEAHRLKRTLGPRRANFSFRAESREPRTLSGAPRATKNESGSSPSLESVDVECVKTRGARSQRSALAWNSVPPKASRRLPIRSESAASQGHHPPAASR